MNPSLIEIIFNDEKIGEYLSFQIPMAGDEISSPDNLIFKVVKRRFSAPKSINDSPSVVLFVEPVHVPS